MTSVERKKIEILARQARALRETWLRERKERKAIQPAAQSEVGRRWKESNSTAVKVPRDGCL